MFCYMDIEKYHFSVLRVHLMLGIFSSSTSWRTRRSYVVDDVLSDTEQMTSLCLCLPSPSLLSFPEHRPSAVCLLTVYCDGALISVSTTERVKIILTNRDAGWEFQKGRRTSQFSWALKVNALCSEA